MTKMDMNKMTKEARKKQVELAKAQVAALFTAEGTASGGVVRGHKGGCVLICPVFLQDFFHKSPLANLT